MIEVQRHGSCVNLVCNQRYSLVTFIPKVLHNQFKFFFNVYFFLICFSQIFEKYSVSPLISNVFPWAIVLVFTLLKEGIDDYKRCLRDAEFNSQIYVKLNALAADGLKNCAKVTSKDNVRVSSKNQVSVSFKDQVDDSDIDRVDVSNLDRVDVSNLDRVDVNSKDPVQRHLYKNVRSSGNEDLSGAHKTKESGNVKDEARNLLKSELMHTNSRSSDFLNNPDSHYMDGHVQNTDIDNKPLIIDFSPNVTDVPKETYSSNNFANCGFSQKSHLMPFDVDFVKSSDIQVGDILFLNKNQRVPADCVLLRSLDSNLFIRTDQLDGETDWKLRIPALRAKNTKAFLDSDISNGPNLTSGSNKESPKRNTDAVMHCEPQIISINSQTRGDSYYDQIVGRLYAFLDLFKSKKQDCDLQSLSKGVDYYSDAQDLFTSDCFVSVDQPHKDIYSFVGKMTFKHGPEYSEACGLRKQLSDRNDSPDFDNHAQNEVVISNLGGVPTRDLSNVENSKERVPYENTHIRTSQPPQEFNGNSSLNANNSLPTQDFNECDSHREQSLNLPESVKLLSAEPSSDDLSTVDKNMFHAVSSSSQKSIVPNSALTYKQTHDSKEHTNASTQNDKQTHHCNGNSNASEQHYKQTHDLQDRITHSCVQEVGSLNCSADTSPGYKEFSFLDTPNTQSNIEEIPLNLENTLWMNTVIASSHCLALVVYTGKQTRSVLNTQEPRLKTALIDLEINTYSKFLFLLSLVCSVVFTVLRGTWKSHATCIKFLVILSNVVPISLKVSIDWARYIYVQIVQKETVVRNSNILEDLGRVEYLICDKTGTLTKNEMELKKIHLGNACFEDEFADLRNMMHEYTASDEKIRRKKANIEAKTHDLLLALAVCHNVTPVVEAGQQTYQASSPDEIAIINWLEKIGIKLVNRTQDEITILENFEKPQSASNALLYDSDQSKMHPNNLRPRNTNDQNDQEVNPASLDTTGTQKPCISSQIDTKSHIQNDSNAQSKTLPGSNNHAQSDICNGSYISTHSNIQPDFKNHTQSDIQNESNAPTRSNVQSETNAPTQSFRGTVRTYKVLHIFPFTSESKRMGIIVFDGFKTELIVKGADTVISKFVRKNDWLKEECSNFASSGLRTLVICKKELKNFSVIHSQLLKAYKSLHRGKHVAKIVSSIEHEMTLLGLTGVEDKLQDNVKEILESLKNAGMKVWMLTGDKLETAINIAISSKLFYKLGNYKVLQGINSAEKAQKAMHEINPQAQDQKDAKSKPQSEVQKSANIVAEPAQVPWKNSQELQPNTYAALTGRKAPYTVSFYEQSQISKKIRHRISQEKDALNNKETISEDKSIQNTNQALFSPLIREQTLKDNHCSKNANEHNKTSNTKAEILENENTQAESTRNKNTQKEKTRDETTQNELSKNQTTQLEITSNKNTQKEITMNKNTRMDDFDEKNTRMDGFSNNILTPPASIHHDSSHFSVPVAESDCYTTTDAGSNINEDLALDSQAATPTTLSSTKETSTMKNLRKIRSFKFKRNKKHDPFPLETQKSSKPYTYMVIEGESLEYLLMNHAKALIAHCSTLQAVVCCRCSPTQKAAIVNGLRAISLRRVAAVGDGGNDVSMITNADVGIGIVGKEGNQASLAADFSVTKFNQIHPLFLWHGRNCYKSTARLAHLIIHRGTIIAVMQAIFCCLFHFSPISLYQGKIIVGYVTLYTCLPVFCSILAKDTTRKTAIKYPELYKDLNRKKQLSLKTFASWNMISVYQGALIMLLSFYLFKNELFSIITITFSSLIINELLMVMFTVKTICTRMVSSICASMFFYVLSFLLMPDQLVIPSEILPFMGKVVIMNLIAILFTAIEKIYCMFKPSSARKITVT